MAKKNQDKEWALEVLQMQDIKPFEPVVLKQSNLMDIIKRAQGQQSASSAATQQPPELRLPAQQQLEQSAVPQPAQLLLLPSLLHLPLLKLPRLLPRGQLLQLLLLLPSVLHLPLLRLPRLLPRGQLLQLLLLLPSVLHLPLLRLPRLLPREQLLLLPSVLHLPLLRLPRGQLMQLLLLLPSVLHLPFLKAAQVAAQWAPADPVVAAQCFALALVEAAQVAAHNSLNKGKCRTLGSSNSSSNQGRLPRASHSSLLRQPSKSQHVRPTSLMLVALLPRRQAKQKSQRF